MSGPYLATFHLFRVPGRRVPRALARVATDRRRLATTPGLRFAKLLGTGDGRTFDLRDADVCTWALVGVWEDPRALAAFERSSPVAAGWRSLSAARWRADLRLLGARGRWSGQEPFGAPGSPRGGAVAALTRARLRPSRMPAFWRAVPPVTADLRRQAGLRFSVGIGEAPVGLQGTFSLWRDEAALRDFAYRGAAHRAVIARTATEGWYAEELFARFAVLQTAGDLDATAPGAGSTGS